MVVRVLVATHVQKKKTVSHIKQNAKIYSVYKPIHWYAYYHYFHSTIF